MKKKIIEKLLESYQTIKIEKKTPKQSLARLEEDLFEAERLGNKRKADSLKKIIKRIKKTT